MREALSHLERFVVDHPHITPVFVYIEEAHAVNEWPIGSTDIERQAATVEERVDAAVRLGLSSRWLIAVDSMDNRFAREFAPWPFRYYLLDHTSRVRVIAQPCGGSLPLGELYDVAAQILSGGATD